MLLRPVVVHLAMVVSLLPVAAVCAVLDRVDAIRSPQPRRRSARTR